MANHENELDQAVRRVVAAILAEGRPMPVPSPVTEVVVRVGPAEALQTLKGSAPPPASGPGGSEAGRGPEECPGRFLREIVEDIDFLDRDEPLLQRVMEAKGLTREQLLGALLHDLLARLLAQELRDFARREGIPEPPAPGTTTA